MNSGSNPQSTIHNPQSVVILGAGPAGLYAGLLLKQADPAREITIVERNSAEVTYGWGVVFSDRTLESFARADPQTAEQIRAQFVIWDAIDVRYRDQTIRCGGHVIASIARRRLLGILQTRCAELGVQLQFSHEIADLSDLPPADLLIAADGLNSVVRKLYAPLFAPTIRLGKAKYIWLGAERVLDAFTFIFHETEHGLFQVHAYPFSGTTSTFIVECDEATWLHAGLDQADEATSLAFCQQMLAEDLKGAPLLSNNSKWINFPTLTTTNWHTKIHNPPSTIQNRVVLLGDAAHTAHFSIGSGTKLAMEDAIALAAALAQHPDLDAALDAYAVERRPVVETFQRAAQESQSYFETIKRYLGLAPLPFTFQLLTRSGRISYDDLRLRDPRFGDAVDRWGAQPAAGGADALPPLVAPPPLFGVLHLRALQVPNRVVLAPLAPAPARDGTPAPDYGALLARAAQRGPGLLLTEPVAVAAEGRITPSSSGLYAPAQQAAWAEIVERVHRAGAARIGIVLVHAGARGATRPRGEGLDRPLRAGAWPLVAASPLPYTPQSQVPAALDRAGMDGVCAAFVAAARLAHDAGFDLLQIHAGHGYLLGGFLSPLTNRRDDAYGGDLAGRMRFPLEVCAAVRAAWPAAKPIAVALSVTDCVQGGLPVEDGVAVARALAAQGSDLITVLAGQTTPDGEPPYGRGFLTPLSDRVRNEAGIRTLVGGYLTTTNEINTILAAGRADLCVLEPPA